MEPTLQIGDELLATKYPYGYSTASLPGFVTLPNSKIHHDGVVNYSRAGLIRTEVRFTVPYSVDIGRVEALVREVAGGDSRILDSPDVEVVVEELTTSGPRLVVSAPIDPADYWDVAPNLRERIKAEFDTRGIPFAVAPFVTDSANPEH